MCGKVPKRKRPLSQHVREGPFATRASRYWGGPPKHDCPRPMISRPRAHVRRRTAEQRMNPNVGPRRLDVKCRIFLCQASNRNVPIGTPIEMSLSGCCKKKKTKERRGAAEDTQSRGGKPAGKSVMEDLNPTFLRLSVYLCDFASSLSWFFSTLTHRSLTYLVRKISPTV
jgi:hypothetical protein